MEPIPVDPTIQIAKGISEYGIMIMLAAACVVILLCLVVFFLNSFKKVFTHLLQQQQVMNDVMDKIDKNNNLMIQLCESAKVETTLRIRNLSGFAFDLSVEHVCKLIQRVRTENHIADHEATSKKIRKLLHNIHEDRKSRFDAFTYRGKALSSYCNPEWVETVAQVVEGEIYHENGPDDKRAFSNVRMAYDDIKLDFYHTLNE